ncbi:hypothetical protein A9Q89_03915 [Gammaproteobacteria bacterium 53_120_T64]|mgnify:CR=1 FL=1|nr:hypothetical protein A9Q89_03915 [Gammaproteobacteria bacterium 53_120_T64]
MSYLVVLLLVFVSLNPAQASISMGPGMGHAAISLNNSDDSQTMACNEASQPGLVADTQRASPMLNRAMAMSLPEGEDCQSACDCCPGLCSAGMPSRFYSATFIAANLLLRDSALSDKVTTYSRLFRPPISH